MQRVRFHFGNRRWQVPSKVEEELSSRREVNATGTIACGLQMLCGRREFVHTANDNRVAPLQVRGDIARNQNAILYFPISLLCSTIMQRSITTARPACLAFSAACSLTIPNCIQTTLAPISIA